MLTNNKIFNKLNKWVAIPLIVALIFATSVLSLSKLAFPSSAASVALSLTGSGTQADPYKIYNVSEFNNFRDYVNDGNNMSGKYIELMADIDALEFFTPVGIGDKFFSGNFNGNWHSISCIIPELPYNVNFDINSDKWNEYGGLFGHIKNATIANLKLSSFEDFLGWYKLPSGALVGFSENSIINDISVELGWTSLNDKDLIPGFYLYPMPLGGVVGKMYGGTISNCFNRGSIVANRIYAGGIIGGFLNGYVSCCYNPASISGASKIKESTVLEFKDTAITNGKKKKDLKFHNITISCDVEISSAGDIYGYIPLNKVSDSRILDCCGLTSPRDVLLSYEVYHAVYDHATDDDPNYPYGYIGSKKISGYLNDDTPKVDSFTLSFEDNKYTYSFGYDIKMTKYTKSFKIEVLKGTQVIKEITVNPRTLDINYTETTTASLKSALLTGFSSDVWAISPNIANGYPHIKGLYWEDYANI